MDMLAACPVPSWCVPPCVFHTLCTSPLQRAELSWVRRAGALCVSPPLSHRPTTYLLRARHGISVRRLHILHFVGSLHECTSCGRWSCMGSRVLRILFILGAGWLPTGASWKGGPWPFSCHAELHICMAVVISVASTCEDFCWLGATQHTY